MHQWEPSPFRDLRVMVHPGARGLLWNIGAETSFGLQPVVAVVSVHRTALNIEMIGVVANLILGRLRRGRGKLL